MAGATASSRSRSANSSSRSSRGRSNSCGLPRPATTTSTSMGQIRWSASSWPRRWAGIPGRRAPLGRSGRILRRPRSDRGGRSARGPDPQRGLGLAGQQAFALRALARQLARPADRFRFLPGLLLGWFFVVAAELHLAENPLALHLLLERLEGLVDIIVPNENLHVVPLGWPSKSGKQDPRDVDVRPGRAPLPALRTFVHRMPRALNRFPGQRWAAGSGETQVTWPIF